VRANRRLLLSAEANLEELVDVGQPALPAVGHVRMTAVTFTGARSVEAERAELGYRRHPAAAVFHAAEGVITELRKIDEAARAGAAAADSPDHSLTRLMVATRSRDPRLVSHLLELGDDTEAQDAFGHTALMFAAHGGSEDIVGMLLAHGANPNAADGQTTTPLMWAAKSDRQGVIRQLLDARAERNTTDVSGTTALLYAERAGHAGSAALLK